MAATGNADIGLHDEDDDEFEGAIGKSEKRAEKAVGVADGSPSVQRPCS